MAPLEVILSTLTHRSSLKQTHLIACNNSSYLGTLLILFIDTDSHILNIIQVKCCGSGRYIDRLFLPLGWQHSLR